MPRTRALRAAAVASAVLLAIIGWYLGSPLFIRTTANEALPSVTVTTTPRASSSAPPSSTVAALTETPVTVLARGALQRVDDLHNGKGAVLLLRAGEPRYVRFEEVAITNAPDVHVYLSRETGGKWSDATSLYLGPLRATNGSFNYDIPAGTDLAPYKSVVVWCRAFAVLVTWADLTPA